MRFIYALPMLAALSCTTFVGCGGKTSPPQALTTEQERQRDEKMKQVEQEERAHQEQVRKTEGSPRR